MAKLVSIESLDPANIVQTMNQPIVVHGSDMNYHYCKYNRHAAKAYRLYKEYLVGSFLSDWEFNAAPVHIIQVQDEHIPANLGINRNYFNSPCFGLEEVPSANELDKHNIELLTKKRLSPRFKEDFLRLSFFDIWIGNEDRSHNNYNLLLSRQGHGFELFPIDHEASFNHGELKGPIIPITYEESLVYSEAFAKLIKRADLRTDLALAGLRDKCYLYALACEKRVAGILSDLPPQWGIDIVSEKTILAGFLFSDEWFNEAWECFETYIQYSINNT